MQDELQKAEWRLISDDELEEYNKAKLQIGERFMLFNPLHPDTEFGEVIWRGEMKEHDDGRVKYRFNDGSMLSVDDVMMSIGIKRILPEPDEEESDEGLTGE